MLDEELEKPVVEGTGAGLPELENRIEEVEDVSETEEVVDTIFDFEVEKDVDDEDIDDLELGIPIVVRRAGFFNGA